MKNIKLFEEASQYEASKDGFEYPTVSYVKDIETVYYMLKPSAYEFVDLGLSVKWATCNVGATKPEEFGLYFAWGETQGYTGITNEKQFTWADYKWSGDEDGNTMTKYPSDGSSTEGGDAAPVDMIEEDTTTLLTLLPEDDAVTTTDSSCRMPTSGECVELTANTTSEWVDDYNGTGVAGRIFTSNVNGNSIFVPAAGICFGGSVYYVGQNGFLWSSSVYSSNVQYAFNLYFVSDDVGVSNGGRYGGLPVRAVRV